MLKRLLPTTLPSAISQFFLKAAIQEVASSGSDVPNATTVRPIIASLTPNDCAILVALFTITSPPTTKPMRPPMINAKARLTDIGL